jgi:hypothetical protein
LPFALLVDLGPVTFGEAFCRLGATAAYFSLNTA